jgi:hypothetical protein
MIKRRRGGEKEEEGRGERKEGKRRKARAQYPLSETKVVPGVEEEGQQLYKY